MPIWVMNKQSYYRDRKILGTGLWFERDLRLVLLRLHAERECLKRILSDIDCDKIQINLSENCCDKLQEYLALSSKRIKNIEKRTSIKKALIEAEKIGWGIDGNINLRDYNSIIPKLKNIRKSVAKKMEEYMKRPVYNNNINVSSTGNGFIAINSPGSRAEIETCMSNELNIDYSLVNNELNMLSSKMKDLASKDEHYIALGALAEASIAAKSKDYSKLSSCLKKVGVWGLDIAQKIGTSIVSDLIRKSMGT